MALLAALASERLSMVAARGKQRKQRFSLLLLEHGEDFLYDFAATLTPPAGAATAGRLRLCSRSLVFEPADARAPMRKFPLRAFSDEAVDLSRGGVAFATSLVLELMADGRVGPSIARPQAPPTVWRFEPAHTAADELQSLVEALRRVSADVKKSGLYVEALLLDRLVKPLQEVKFEMRQLVDYTEDILDLSGIDLKKCVLPAERVAPLLRYPGAFVATTQRLYFEPGALNNIGDTALSFAYADVVSCRKCRHMMEQRGLEFEVKGKPRKCLRIALEDETKRDAVWAALARIKPLAKVMLDANAIISQAQDKWRKRELDNYGYLAVLNHVAERSVQDLSQYPVFPWVLRDYESVKLDLTKPGTFRDLSRPIGALDESRLEQLVERCLSLAAPSASMDELAGLHLEERAAKRNVRPTMRGIFQKIANVGSSRTLAAGGTSPVEPRRRASSACSEGESEADRRASMGQALAETYESFFSSNAGDPRDAPFLYGTHYSTPGYVLFYLVRAAPEFMLCLQNGKFDSPDRMFASIAAAWKSVQTNSADLKELIPEFYDGDGDFLQHTDDVPLGSTQAGDRLGDVKLPPWARSPRDFVKKHRAALESDHVSAHLHEWVDLIFGCKQRGAAAARAANLFHPLTYEGAVDVAGGGYDARDKLALEMQIGEFGQTPRQLFDVPHPRRDAAEDDTADALRATKVPPPSAAVQKSSARTPPPPPLAPPPPPPTAATRGAAPPQPRPAERPGVSRPAPSHGVASSHGAASSHLADVGPKRPDILGLVGSRPMRLHSDVITGVAHACGTLATASRDGSLKLSDFDDGGALKARRSFAASRQCLAAVALTRDARLAVAGGWDAHIVVYDVNAAALVSRVEAHDAAISSVALAGDALVTGAWDATVKLWRLSPAGLDARPLLELYDHESAVCAVSASSSGSLVAAAADDGCVLVWDARVGGAGGAGAPIGRCELPGDGAAAAVAVCTTAQGHERVFAARGSQLCEVALDGTLRGCADCGFEVRCITPVADGSRLYVACGGGEAQLTLFDTSTLERSAFVGDAHGAAVAALCAFDRNGEPVLVSAAEDCTVRTWVPHRRPR